MSSFHPSRRHGWRNRRSRWGPPPSPTPGHVLVPMYPTYNGWAPYGMPAPRWCPPPRPRQDRRDRSRSRHRDRRNRSNGSTSSGSRNLAHRETTRAAPQPPRPRHEPNHTLRELERFAKDDSTCIHISEFSKLRRDFPDIDPNLFHDLFWVAEGRSARQAVQSIRKALRRIRFSRNTTGEIFRTRYEFLREKYIQQYNRSSWQRVPCSTAESALFDNSVKQAVLAVRMQYFATQANIVQFYEEITWIEEQSRVITEKQQKMKASNFLDLCPKACFCKETHGTQKCWIWEHGNDIPDGEEVRILPCGHMCHLECVDTLIAHALKEKKSPRCGICGKDIPDHRSQTPPSSPREGTEIEMNSNGSESDSASNNGLSNISESETQLPEDNGQSDGSLSDMQLEDSDEPLSATASPEHSDINDSVDELIGSVSYEDGPEYEGIYEEPDESFDGDADRTGTDVDESEEEVDVFSPSPGDTAPVYEQDDVVYEEPCEEHIPEEILYY